MTDLAPAFERTSGHKLSIIYGTAVPLKRQIDSGETFDIVVLVPTMLDDLIKQNKVAAGTSTNVAKVGVRVTVKKAIRNRSPNSRLCNRHAPRVGSTIR